MRKYLKKVTKLDTGRGDGPSGESISRVHRSPSRSPRRDTATTSSTIPPSSSSPTQHRRQSYRSENTATSPSSTCSTIASALWRPLWPPGWHPRGAAANTSATASSSPSSSPIPSSATPDKSRRKSSLFNVNPPVITMSRPSEEESTNSSNTSKQLPIKSQQKQQQQPHFLTHQKRESLKSQDDETPSPSKSPDEEENEFMEAWLDEHPAFLQNYFVRKASRSIVDAWLQARTSHSAGAASGSASAPVSGAATPVRKISAHEFEKCSLFLRPMVSTTSDGTPTFLPVSPADGSTGDSLKGPPRKSRQELEALDEKQLIFELVKDICNDLDVKSLCHKILQNVSILTNADRCSLFLVKGEKDDPDRHFRSTLFDVSSESTIEQMEKAEEIRVPWNTGIVGYAATTGESVHISDCYSDERFSDLVDKQTGYKTRNMLCAPIYDIFGDVMGVAQVINKKIKVNSESSVDETVDDFTTSDMEVFSQYLQFCGIGLRNAQLFERSQLENKRNQVLLDLARMVFEEQSTIEHIVYRIMVHIQSLLEVERCQILLIADDSEYSESRKTFSRVFDLEAGDSMMHNSRDSEGNNDDDDVVVGDEHFPHEGRFPINVGITGYVATTGITLNIPNAYEDSRFDSNVDLNNPSGFKHSAILCMPIRNASGKIIGVSQLVNKMKGGHFTKNDENLFEAFAIFCGMGIHNVQMFEKVVKSMAKQKVTFEILSYHATAPFEEAQELAKSVVPSTQALRLFDFAFSDFSLDEDTMVKATLRMFLDLDLIERFHIDYGVLCRWLLSVRKNYRPVTYHNWRHAFNVAQMMFAMLTATGLVSIIGEIETLGLLVACLCHDLDHRGTNNSFQIKSSSPLAQLYSTSVMERHHFDQCLMILNSEGNQILSSLSPEEYKNVIHVLEEAILATDIAIYFKNRGVFFKLIDSNDFDFIYSYDCNSSGRKLLRGMLMTACDIAAITKPWEIQRIVAQLVASEFFQQGDIEKNQLNMEPSDMMNRDKSDELPKMQVSFIDTVCLPIYQAFAKLYPKQLTSLLDGVITNRNHWIKLAQEQDKLKEWAEAESARLILESEKNSTDVNSSKRKASKSLYHPIYTVIDHNQHTISIDNNNDDDTVKDDQNKSQCKPQSTSTETSGDKALHIDHRYM